MKEKNIDAQKLGSLGGKASAKKLTQKERSERAKKGGTKRWEEHKRKQKEFLVDTTEPMFDLEDESNDLDMTDEEAIDLLGY